MTPVCNHCGETYEAQDGVCPNLEKHIPQEENSELTKTFKLAEVEDWLDKNRPI